MHLQPREPSQIIGKHARIDESWPAKCRKTRNEDLSPLRIHAPHFFPSLSISSTRHFSYVGSTPRYYAFGLLRMSSISASTISRTSSCTKKRRRRFVRAQPGPAMCCKTFSNANMNKSHLKANLCLPAKFCFRFRRIAEKQLL